MSLINKIFGHIKGSKDKSPQDERGKYMPAQDIPIDDRFMKNFIGNGGKFIYCTEKEEAEDAFEKILKENNWEGETTFCTDENLQSFFQDFSLKYSKNIEAPFCISTCEYLVADLGAILMSSNQIGEKKLSELPNNFVILAGTSQLIETIGDGLIRIKARNDKLPTNISTIKNFDRTTLSDGHFMNYGSISKNLYLLLLEDY